MNPAFASSYRELSAPAARLFRSLATELEPGRGFVTPQEVAALVAASIAGGPCLLDELSEVGLLQRDPSGSLRVARAGSRVRRRAAAEDTFLLKPN